MRITLGIFNVNGDENDSFEKFYIKFYPYWRIPKNPRQFTCEFFRVFGGIVGCLPIFQFYPRTCFKIAVLRKSEIDCSGDCAWSSFFFVSRLFLHLYG